MGLRRSSAATENIDDAVSLSAVDELWMTASLVGHNSVSGLGDWWRLTADFARYPICHGGSE